MTFSEKLITLRAGRGWSQEKLSLYLGVTRQAVGRWERSECLPDAVGLTNLARIFDVDPEWLLDDDAGDEPKPKAARRARFEWFDWLMLGLMAASIVAMLCGLNMGAAEQFRHSAYRYPSWTWGVATAQVTLWFSVGWVAVALLFCCIACPSPQKKLVKMLCAVLGAVLAAWFLTCVLIVWMEFLTDAPRINIRPFLKISENPALFVIPGVLLSCSHKRKEKPSFSAK